jgi:hypothetical protein
VLLPLPNPPLLLQGRALLSSHRRAYSTPLHRSTRAAASIPSPPALCLSALETEMKKIKERREKMKRQKIENKRKRRRLLQI